MEGNAEVLRRIEKVLETGETHLSLGDLPLRTLPPEIGRLKHLKVLDIYENGLMTLPPEIGQLESLEKLRIGEKHLRDIPPEIGELSQLRELYFENCPITTLPDTIGKLQRLEKLWVRFGHLKALPAGIGQLSNLIDLSLPENRLTTLPAEMVQLSRLEQLNLYRNQFTEFPMAITGMKALYSLTIANNHITSLPPEIGWMDELRYLQLDHNFLETLPPEIGRMKNLYSLEVNHNRLTELPPLAWKNLECLFLAGNRLTVLPSLPVPESGYMFNLTLDENPLVSWPERGPANITLLTLRGCSQLTGLPTWLKQVAGLDVHDCRTLKEVKVRVMHRITLSGTGIKALPEDCQTTEIFWDWVQVDERIAFRPETITAEEVLNEPNVELRRVMLERMGYERFIEQTQPQILDSDTDAGGVRQLLRIEMGDDEPLVLLRVHDPSTERQYLLRVPPTMRTCHQAAAWIAGFDNLDDYRPIVET